MKAKQTPSPDTFVVGGDDADTGSLERLGDVEAIKDRALNVVRVSNTDDPDPKATWKAILEAAKSVGWASPVLIDETGERHVPTGEVSVRFKRALSDGELTRFAKKARVVVVDRNEFIPEQVVFRPINSRQTFLPDLVLSLEQAEEVESAWANTLTRYTKA